MEEEEEMTEEEEEGELEEKIFAGSSLGNMRQRWWRG